MLESLINFGRYVYGNFVRTAQPISSVNLPKHALLLGYKAVTSTFSTKVGDWITDNIAGLLPTIAGIRTDILNNINATIFTPSSSVLNTFLESVYDKLLGSKLVT